jgi:hypothetical protein
LTKIPSSRLLEFPKLVLEGNGFSKGRYLFCMVEQRICFLLGLKEELLIIWESMTVLKIVRKLYMQVFETSVALHNRLHLLSDGKENERLGRVHMIHNETSKRC